MGQEAKRCVVCVREGIDQLVHLDQPHPCIFNPGGRNQLPIYAAGEQRVRKLAEEHLEHSCSSVYVVDKQVNVGVRIYQRSERGENGMQVPFSSDSRSLDTWAPEADRR